MAELNPPTSAGLYRRLAEAADGFRDGAPVWFAAHRLDPNQEVLGPFRSQENVLSAAEAEPGYDAFGPFITDPESAPVGEEEIVGAAVWVKEEDGSFSWAIYQPSDVDAVFLTDSAIDKFVVPYLSQVHGPAYTEQIRGTQLPSIVGRPCCHSPISITRSCGKFGPFDPNDPTALMDAVRNLLNLA